MFRLYSKGCEYILKALVCLGMSGSKAYSAKEICRKARIPEAYTRKAFQALVRGGLLKSGTGPGGGYTLADSPENISVLRIIEEVEGKESFNQCIMGLPRCGDNKPCPLHSTWTDSKLKLIDDLKKKTLRDLIDVSGKGKKK